MKQCNIFFKILLIYIIKNEIRNNFEKIKTLPSNLKKELYSFQLSFNPVEVKSPLSRKVL